MSMNKCLVLILVVLLCIGSIQFVKADWSMFRSDLSHSGMGTNNPVLTPTLLWKFNAGGSVYSSPAIVNGVVYVGTENGNFYALNATNGLKFGITTLAPLQESGLHPL